MRISPRQTNSSKQLSPQEYENKIRQAYTGFLTEDQIQEVLKNPPPPTPARKEPHGFPDME